MATRNKKKLVAGDPVMIEWVDSQHYEGWQHVDTMDDCVDSGMTCTTVGHWFDERKDRIAVVMNQGYKNDGEEVRIGSAAQLMVIPKSCVKSIKKLR